MDFNRSVYYMEKRGNLQGFSEQDKLEFMRQCNSNFLFYDPYKDLLVNPITSKTYFPKLLQRLFVSSSSLLNERIYHNLPSKLQADKAVHKIFSRRKKAYITQTVFWNFKYLGVIIGVILGYFFDLYLGLAVGLYLIYLDYNLFDKVNGVFDQIEVSKRPSPH